MSEAWLQMLPVVAGVWTGVALLTATAYFARASADRGRRLLAQNEALNASRKLLEQAADIGLQTAEICHNINHFLQTRQLFTQILEERGWHKRYVEHLEFSNRNLHRLSRDVQNLLRPEPDTADRHPQPLRALLDTAMRVAAEFTGLDGIAFDNQVPDTRTLRFDDSLQDVLNNIFINALQSMKMSATRSITCRCDDAGLHIADTGPGIPEADLGRLFSTQYSTQGKSIGLGMGYIRRRCTQNGVDLRIVSGPGGTTLTLPTPPEAS